MENSWIYNGEVIEKLPEGTFGFIYLITNLSNNKKYVGCKQAVSRRKRKFGKKELAKITDKRLKKYEIVVKESDWKKYTGSNKSLNEDIKNGDSIKREILKFVPNKKQLTYYEVKEMFNKSVLEDSDYYNDNILGKFFKGINAVD